jgi:ribonuclease R
MTKRKRTPKVKGTKLTAHELRSEVFRLFKRHPRKRMSAKQIIKKLKILNNKDSVTDALEKLAQKSKLEELNGGKYQLAPFNGKRAEKRLHEGIVDMTRKGSAYIIVDNLENDVHVSAKYIRGAMDGDRVQVSVFTPPGRRRAEGEIVKVISRVREHFMGTIRLWKNYALVTPENLTTPMEIFVDLKDAMDARDGDVVVVRITKWPEKHNHSPKGVVTSVLGAPGSSDIEMKGILINNGFELDFPPAVMAQADALPEEVNEAEIFNRRDIRDIPTFTIDPVDAKDFDDALSFRYLENGNREVGVHIADVTHYVKPNSPLDKEALKRSTSVYLVDRVLPMLPEKISNKLCSLRPNEDKFTFSAIFVFDKEDRIVDRWFGKTVIHSDRRFTYEEAQEVVDSGKGDHVDDLKELNKIAKKLRKKRFKGGSINFDVDEVRFKLDEEGVPVEVYVKERKDAHLLIEDFMLLANREVATYIRNKGQSNEIPYVYRVHDEPDPDKLQEFALFAKNLGFEMSLGSPQEIASSFNRLVEAAKENESLELLEPLAIRTMAKAEYSTNNIGHYGLGFDNYAHFTSPIRRYSDVLAHRILEANLKGTFRMDKVKVEEQCKHISTMERRAIAAERESIKYKQVEYIEKHVGDEFFGYISGIMDRGIFVELAGNHCEGMVPFASLDDEFEVVNGRLQARGLYSGRQFKMGDKLKVRIVSADLASRRIEMELVEE